MILTIRERRRTLVLRAIHAASLLRPACVAVKPRTRFLVLGLSKFIILNSQFEGRATAA